MIQDNPYVSSNIWGDGWKNPYSHNTGMQIPSVWGTPWAQNAYTTPNMGMQYPTSFGTNMPNVWGTPWTNNLYMNPNIGTWPPATIGATHPWNTGCNMPWTWMGQNITPTQWYTPSMPQNTIQNPYNQIHGISTHAQQVPINTMNPGLTPWMTTQANNPWGTYPFVCR